MTRTGCWGLKSNQFPRQNLNRETMLEIFLININEWHFICLLKQKKKNKKKYHSDGLENEQGTG